jgi:hypothetical protein
MQYPYEVVFVEGDAQFPYLVKANDIRQAERRARREYLADEDTGSSGSLARVTGLEPKKQEDQFLPRVNGKVLPVPACATHEDAVQASLTYLDEQKERT